MIQRLAGPGVRVMPIIKAFGYGHDPLLVIQALRGLPVYGFGVAYGSEAFYLRQHGYQGRIVVLSSWEARDLPALAKKNIDVVVWDKSSWSAVERLKGRRPAAHLKIDTGTSRIGFLPSDVRWLRQRLLKHQLNVVGVFSHFANSEELPTTRTTAQLIRFTTLAEQLPLPRGIERHIACSAAAMRFPGARFGLLRPGLAVYGIWPSQATKRAVQAKKPAVSLQPALAWKTRLVQVKRLPAGTSVGYGSTVTVRQPTTIGVLPIGYADGFRRALSNRGWVVIAGHRAPIIGRVCMNLTMVDLTAVRRPRVHQEVTLLGRGISADDIARCEDTIAYEVLTDIRSSLPRYLVP